MEFKSLTSSEKIPVLGLGTWQMGGNMRADYSRDKDYIEAIQYAIEKGINHIDTAEAYSAGHAEELVGEAIKGKRREKLFITSKVWPFHLSHDGIINACKSSLTRLKTGYLDLYLIHWPNPLASMKNAMAAFDELVDAEMVRFIGVSNFSVKQFRNAQKYAKNKIVTNQVHYSLLHRHPQTDMLPFCQKEKIILTAYSPLGHGELVKNSYEEINTVAHKYHKTPVQMALRWLLDQPQVIAIPKASSKKHIDEILGSLGWKLEKEDHDFLTRSKLK